MKIKEAFNAVFKKTNNLFKNNKDAVSKYNKHLILVSYIITMFILIIPIIFSIFRQSMRETLPAYLIVFLVLAILLTIFITNIIKIHSLVYVYLLGLVFFALVSYLSLVRFDTRPAATMLVFFVVAPLLFVDYSWRINIYVFLMFLVHSFYSFDIKGDKLGSIDLLNTLVSLMIGIVFGRLFLVSRLNTFEMERLLTNEKETDFLTGLSNRRKLFDNFNKLSSLNESKIGVIMIDIDYFKEYNDLYGHLQGDACLVEFGKMLLKLQESNNVNFYRFGGEEFVGVTKGIDQDELVLFAEEIRESIGKLNLSTQPITISIGLSICSGECYLTIDHFLLKADEALYVAKNSGRNRIETNF